MSPRVVLIGPMGAGKTTVAHLLGQAWSLPVRDTDADVEAADGRTVADIFIESGEATFRRLEAEAVARALAEHDGVLALGGGAVLDPVSRDRLAGHRVVYLSVGLASAVRRVGLGAGRPLVMGNVRARLKEILDERHPVYAAVAAHTVVTDDRSPDEVAGDVRDWVETTVGSHG